ncbi:MAG: hypothetical protein RIK87_08375 [Fuerstiella sp.]
MIQLDTAYSLIVPTTVEDEPGNPAGAILPTLYRNGSASGVTVTPTNIGTGVYRLDFTTLGLGDGWARTDRLEMYLYAYFGSGSTNPRHELVWDSGPEPDAVMRGTDAAALATDLATVAGYVDTEIGELQSDLAAVKATTDQMVFSTPNQLDVQVITVAPNGITAAGIAASALDGKGNWSTHDAAAVRADMEANGTKLDHLWETTEDDAGTRRFTGNALAQAPTGAGLADGDIDDIANAVVTGVTAVKPRIKDSVAGTYRLIAGDTWNQQFEVAAPAADRIVVAVKEALTDSDDDAVILIDNASGLLRLNKADASVNAADGTVTSDASTITVSLESDRTIEVPPARYYLIVKTLDVGADKTWEYEAVLNVYQAGVRDVSAG